MSTTVDQRVVEMRFDNKNFESNVSQSMSTLEKLKRSLNLNGATKGLEGISASAKKVDLSGIGRGVEEVSAKFSALQVMGITALANITNSAVNAGKRLVSALTIDPVKTGFQEYETKINAVQTILSNTSNKGTTMSDVTKVLDELNLYADKTIYNFAEMTRNIGTFTAAGVGLKESASAIQGIANLAAASGSSSQQASTAMYQLSQALAAGTVKLQDWNSVVNAGMGGQKFQEALKATAREHGVAVDKIIEEQGSFRESLQKGWISADILNETLSKFTVDGAQKYAKSMMESGKWTQEQADTLIKEAKSMEEAATKVKTFTQLWDTMKESAQSGWAQTWEIIVGDFEKAKGRLSEVSDLMGEVIGNSANRRNDLLEGALTSKWDILVKKLNSAGIESDIFQEKIKELSGTHKEEFQKMIEESDTFEEAVKKALSAGIIDKSGIKNALKGVTDEFSKLSDEELKNKGYTEEQIKSFRELSKQANETGGTIDKLISGIDKASGAELIWDSFLNVLKSIIAPMGAIQDAWDEIFPPNPEGIYNTVKAIKEFTDGMLKAATNSENLKNITRIFKGIFSVVDIVWTVIKEVAGGIGRLVGNFTGLGGGVLGVAASFGDFLSKIRDSIKETNIFGKSIDKVVNFITNCINKIKEFGSEIRESLKVPEFDGFLGFFKTVAALIKSIGSGIGKAFSGLGKGMAEALGKVDVYEMLNILNSGLFSGVLVSVINFIRGITKPFKEAGGVLDGIKGILDGVRDSLETYQKNLKANILLKIAGAIGILAIALAILSTIDSDKIESSLVALTVCFGELIGAMALMEKLNSSKDPVKPLNGLIGSLANISKTIQMIGLSAAVLILAGAMKTISEIDWDGVFKGLVGIGGMMAMLVAAAKIMDSESKAITKFAGQMILISVAVGILARIAKYISNMSWEELGKAGSGLLGMIAMFVAAAKIMDGENKAITKFAGQMILMSVAVGILAVVAKYLSSMSWEELGKGGAGILGIITMLVAAAKIMNKNESDLTKFAGQMILMSAAVGILAVVAKRLSSMSWNELAKGGTAVLGLVIMLTSAAKIMDSKYKSITKFAGQMILMATALAILAPVLKSLGGMSLESVAKGLISIGVSMGILAVGLKYMTGTMKGSVALIVAATALAIITPVLKTLGSMNLESIFTALTAIAGAMLTIGIGAMALGPLIPAILGLAGAFALLGVATLGIGAGLALVGAGLTSIAAAGTAAAASLVASIGIIVTGFIGLIPAIMNGFGEAIIAFCGLIGNVAPQIAEAALQLVSSVLDSLATYTPQIVDSLLTLLIGIINGLATHMPELIQAAVNLVGALFKGIVGALNGIDTTNLLKGIIAIGLVTGLMYALSGVVALIPSAMAGVLGVGAVIAELALVLAAIGGLAQIPGLEWLISEGGDFLQKVGKAIGQFIGGITGGIAEGVTASLPQVGINLSSFMTNLEPFIDGVKNIDESMFSSIQTLVKSILLLTGVNVVDSIASFITGGSSFDDFGKKLVSFGKSLNDYGKAVEGINKEAIAGSAEAAKSIVEVANAIPSEGGFWSLISGDKDLGSFGKKLAPFGEGMKAYAEAVAGVNTDSIVASADAAKALVKVAGMIPDDGGIWGAITGNKDLGSFGRKLVPFGEGMKKYAEAVAGLNVTAITSSEPGAKSMVRVAKAIPEDLKVSISSNAMASLGTKLVAFANAMKKYSSDVAGVSAGSITSSVSAAKAMVSLVKSMNGVTTGGVNSFVTAINKLGTAQVSKFVQAFKGASPKMASAGKDLMNALMNGIKSGQNGVISIINAMLSNMSNRIKGKMTMFREAGVALMTNFANGIKSKSSSVSSAITSMVSSAASRLRSNYSGFHSAGMYVARGFANGIRANSYLAEARAKAMANAAERAAKKALDINSPSKVFRRIGYSVPEGFAQGIERMSKLVNISTFDMTKKAIAGAKTSMAHIESLMNADIDSQPRIRPVVDLSEVQSGANAIDGMFSSGISIGANANLNAISTAMAQNSQNGMNSDIISAINNLGKQLGNVSNATYNVNGITYDDGSNISNAVSDIIRAARIERRI